MSQAHQLLIDPAELLVYEEACEQATRLGGAVLMEYFGNVTPRRKGTGDWVSQADLEAQLAIRACLLGQFPNHCFLGEERISEADQTGEADLCWIVDPLDGTVNYLHQLRSFSVSIALAVRDPATRGQQVVTGAVLDPTLDEFFSASLGKGAWLNGEPIRASQCVRLADALTVVSTNTCIAPTDPQVKRMLNVMATPASMRRLGSAALNLCYLGCGRVDAYWATNLSCWDIAAGWLIATEAGACLEDFEGVPLELLRPKFCCAATRALMDELKPLLCV